MNHCVSLYNSLAILLHVFFLIVIEFTIQIYVGFIRFHLRLYFQFKLICVIWCFTGLVLRYNYYYQLRVMESTSPSLLTQFWISPYDMHFRPYTVVVSWAVVILVIYNTMVSSCPCAQFSFDAFSSKAFSSNPFHPILVG